MNQWNRLKVQIIKKRRVRCDSLELPPSFKTYQSQLSSRSGENVNSVCSSGRTPSGVSSSHSTSSGESGADSYAFKSDLSFDSATIEAEKSFNSSASHDDVFSGVLETPIVNERFFKRKRCFSLPTCLNFETENTNRRVCFEQGRSVAHDMSARVRVTTGTGPRSVESGEGWSEFPRWLGGSQIADGRNSDEKSGRTSHAVTIVGQDKRLAQQLINHDHNKTSVSKSGKFKASLRSWRSDSDLRSDWDHKVLDYTSETVFGAERFGAKREPELLRSRSVTLTGSVYGEVVRTEDRKVRDQKERVRSEGKQTMPKFQNVLWDYVKRRSSKRKQGQENSTQNRGESYVEVTKKRSNSDQTECRSMKRSTSDPASFSASATTHSTRPARRAMNMAPSHTRSCSWDERHSQNKTKISLEEFKDNPEILKLMLTNDPERRPIEERLKTLTFSREWLLKELKELRENDRSLARQFIHLRSAILEVKKAREKEESDYDSEGEGYKIKTVDARRLELQKEGNGADTEYHLHITPARNILSYC